MVEKVISSAVSEHLFGRSSVDLSDDSGANSSNNAHPKGKFKVNRYENDTVSHLPRKISKYINSL